MVLGNFQCRGVIQIWIIVEQGPILIPAEAGGGCLDIFSLPFHISYFFRSRLDVDQEPLTNLPFLCVSQYSGLSIFFRTFDFDMLTTYTYLQQEIKTG